MTEQNTTFEQAKRCPRCDIPGEDVSSTASNDSRGKPVSVHTIFCRNDKCRWYNTSWIIQVNQDGSIPEAYSALGSKKFPGMSQETETRVREGLEAQLAAETRPGGGEIRNPRA